MMDLGWRNGLGMAEYVLEGVQLYPEGYSEHDEGQQDVDYHHTVLPEVDGDGVEAF